MCDEILSALDVSVQASIIDLIRTLRRKTDVTILFISHDLAVVHELSDRVAVLFSGEVVEIGPVEAVFKPPYHPYTLQLLNAIPDIDKRGSLSAKAAAPNAGDFVGGCPFRSRCQWHMGEACDMVAPPWQDAADGFRIRCHRSLHELAALAEEATN
jgi:peptide/nickel transport system ATP-binding protein